MFKINNKNIQKIKYFSLGLITSSLLFSSVTFADNSAIKIYLNGKLLENAEVINVNNSTYLPVRKLCEALKMKVNFDSANNSVIIDSSDIDVNNIQTKQIQENQKSQQQNSINNTSNDIKETTYNGIKSININGKTYFNGREYNIKFPGILNWDNKKQKAYIKTDNEHIEIENLPENIQLLYGQSYFNIKYYR